MSDRALLYSYVRGAGLAALAQAELTGELLETLRDIRDALGTGE